MPSIFTPTPAETERKDPGFGGKPPVDRARPAEGAAEETTTGGRSAGARVSCFTAPGPLSSAPSPAT